jgi:hypothetical protein
MFQLTGNSSTLKKMYIAVGMSGSTINERYLKNHECHTIVNIRK